MIRCPRRMRHGAPLLVVLAGGCGWLGGDSPLSSNDSLLRYVPLDPADAPPMALLSTMTGMFRGFQDIYSRETMDVWFTERGVEIPLRVELAQ